nr:oligosaccharide flippase family protein [Kineosporia babensis]
MTGRHVHRDPADLDSEDDTPQISNKSRIIWTFADQALSSLANFALSIVVARQVTKEDFGSFSLMLVTFTFLIGLGRAGIGDPYVIRFTDADRHTRRRAQRQAAGSAISFGVVTGLICAAAAAVMYFVLGDHVSALAILGLGLAMPGLMLQETWRSAFFAAGRPRTATINDAVRTAIQFGLLAVLLVQPEPSVFLITLAWGAGALVAALIGILQTRVAPDPFEAMAWFRETRDINMKMAADFSFNQGATTLVSYVVSGIVGKVAIGGIRAAQTLLGPLNLLFSGISSFGLPMLSRTAMAGQSLLKGALMLSAGIGGIAGTWVLILLLVPTSIGGELLGDSWATAREVMLPMGIIVVCVGFVLGASLGLKALRRADQMLRVTFVQAPLMLGLGSLGGALWSGPGAAWGMATAQIAGFVASWIIFLKADKQPRPWIEEEAAEALRAQGNAGRARDELYDDRYDERFDERFDERERHGAQGFWSEDEQERWALDEPEQRLAGRQAEEPWGWDERDRHSSGGRSGRDPQGRDLQGRDLQGRDPRGRDPRDRDGYESPAGSQAEGWYDPTGPTVAVRQDGQGFGPSGRGSEGAYDAHEPTVAVRQDRGGRPPSSQGQFPAPWESAQGGPDDGRRSDRGNAGARDWDEPGRGQARGGSGSRGEVRGVEIQGDYSAHGEAPRRPGSGRGDARGRDGYADQAQPGPDGYGAGGPARGGSAGGRGGYDGQGRGGHDTGGQAAGRGGYDTGGQAAGRGGYDAGGRPSGGREADWSEQGSRSQERDGLSGRGRSGRESAGGRGGYEAPADGRAGYESGGRGGYATPANGRGPAPQDYDERGRGRGGYATPGEGQNAYGTPVQGYEARPERGQSRGAGGQRGGGYPDRGAGGREYGEPGYDDPGYDAAAYEGRGHDGRGNDGRGYEGRGRESGRAGGPNRYDQQNPYGDGRSGRGQSREQGREQGRSREPGRGQSAEDQGEDPWPFPEAGRRNR